MPMLSDASTPIMPALADDNTASMKRRRLSIRSLALTRSSRWVRNSWVILLKVSPSWARSPSDLCMGTCTGRSPVETILAALISRRMGATSQFAKFRPIRIGALGMVRGRHPGEHHREAYMNADPARFDRSIFGGAGLRLVELGHDARIEQARDI